MADIVEVLEAIAAGERPVNQLARSEVKTAADLIRKTRDVLDAVEWAGLEDHPQGGYYPACPVCGQAHDHYDAVPEAYRGHLDDCALGELIDYIRAREP